MNRKLTISLSAILVVGCSSFNNSFNTYPPAQPVEPLATGGDSNVVAVPPVAPPAAENRTVTSTQTPCSISPFVGVPKTPELPNLHAAILRKDIQEIERLERKHINELRAYISRFRHANQAIQIEYMSKCKSIAK